MRLTVVLPAHNPNAERLARTLRGLRGQTLPVSAWETLLVDNASSPALASAALADSAPPNVRIVREERLGLSHARRRGFVEARGEFLVLVDDDNVLAPDYLALVLDHFAANPRLGAIGGPSRPEFESPPAPWTREFFPLLAIRDLGPQPLRAGLHPPGAARAVYPPCAPIGAGLALARAAAQVWLDRADPAALTDRRGGELTSGGDNDIVFRALRAGWEAGYFPDLVLTHLIPDSRLAPAYLARLNRGIQRSWVQVLALHDASPWPAIPRWTVPLRAARAFVRAQAWRSPARHVRWQGLVGRFEGQAAITPHVASKP